MEKEVARKECVGLTRNTESVLVVPHARSVMTPTQAPQHVPVKDENRGMTSDNGHRVEADHSPEREMVNAAQIPLTNEKRAAARPLEASVSTT